MAFIQGALDKEIRLSFAQRIKGTLPDPYPKLITAGKEKDTPEFKYSSESRFILWSNGREQLLTRVSSGAILQRRTRTHAAYSEEG